MSNIKAPHSIFHIGKDDYTKKCHYTIRHHTCGHSTWTRPRVLHVGCQHNPLTKKRCDNMASRPKDVYTNDLCHKCRPNAKERNSDPFDILLRKAQDDERARERISRMAHLTSTALGSVEEEKMMADRAKMARLYPVVAKPAEVERKVALKDNQKVPVEKAKKVDVDDVEQKSETKNGKNAEIPAKETSKAILSNKFPAEKSASQPAPKSLLTNVWNIIKPSKVNTVQKTESDTTDDWSDSDEKVDWKFMRDEDNHLWKDNDDWVHVE